ncbi:replication-associated protein [Cricket associated circular virus 1]|uniref:ATP-dependent helicase Rep n=2 Tax=Volvovirus TaxID=2502019 RepID=M1JD72_9VIRU|nr:hypothetical protein [Acheta domesticus volvovirus]AXL65913.1 replication-associated protein [Cricket associated circular virus 1]AGE84321.1 nonstructural replication protein-like protein [Acheta domesticus volvovirus]AGJ03167.1 hypothetical protein [Acheta domesticus volvovirus]AGJ03171.1 hypothetical protein [Acheta domesticus volvovirus]QQM18920.1 putative nonstructural replication protein [Acheta domesticus volvovirus]
MRFRHWIGTSFNLESIPDDESTIKQIAYQRERCPETNRLHLQFCISFTNPRTMDGVKRYIGDQSAHLEPCRNLRKGLEYCNKSESFVDNRFSRFNTDAQDAPDDFREFTELQLWQKYPNWMLKHGTQVRRYYQICQEVPQTREKPVCYIFWGPAGTGKSYSARHWLGDQLYIKPPGNFWIGYNGEKAVLFDDYYSSEKYDDLLRWISENPIHVSIKGSSTPLKAIKFAFTSNMNPRSWHSKIEDHSALFRRITKCFFCTDKCFSLDNLHE